MTRTNKIDFVYKILVVVILTFQSVRSDNIDCHGKSFHCVNSTHFMICVGVGGGFSSTVDDFIIPCPTATECHRNNNFECEFPPSTTPTTILQSSDVANDLDFENYAYSTKPPWESFDTTMVLTPKYDERPYAYEKDLNGRNNALTDSYLNLEIPTIKPKYAVFNKAEPVTITPTASPTTPETEHLSKYKSLDVFMTGSTPPSVLVTDFSNQLEASSTKSTNEPETNTEIPPDTHSTSIISTKDIGHDIQNKLGKTDSSINNLSEDFPLNMPNVDLQTDKIIVNNSNVIGIDNSKKSFESTLQVELLELKPIHTTVPSLTSEKYLHTSGNIKTIYPTNTNAEELYNATEHGPLHSPNNIEVIDYKEVSTSTPLNKVTTNGLQESVNDTEIVNVKSNISLDWTYKENNEVFEPTVTYSKDLKINLTGYDKNNSAVQHTESGGEPINKSNVSKTLSTLTYNLASTTEKSLNTLDKIDEISLSKIDTISNRSYKEINSDWTGQNNLDKNLGKSNLTTEIESNLGESRSTNQESLLETVSNIQIQPDINISHVKKDSENNQKLKADSIYDEFTVGEIEMLLAKGLNYSNSNTILPSASVTPSLEFVDQTNTRIPESTNLKNFSYSDITKIKPPKVLNDIPISNFDIYNISDNINETITILPKYNTEDELKTNYQGNIIPKINSKTDNTTLLQQNTKKDFSNIKIETATQMNNEEQLLNYTADLETGEIINTSDIIIVTPKYIENTIYTIKPNNTNKATKYNTELIDTLPQDNTITETQVKTTNYLSPNFTLSSLGINDANLYDEISQSSRSTRNLDTSSTPGIANENDNKATIEFENVADQFVKPSNEQNQNTAKVTDVHSVVMVDTTPNNEINSYTSKTLPKLTETVDSSIKIIYSPYNSPTATNSVINATNNTEQSNDYLTEKSYSSSKNNNYGANNKKLNNNGTLNENTTRHPDSSIKIIYSPYNSPTATNSVINATNNTEQSNDYLTEKSYSSSKNNNDETNNKKLNNNGTLNENTTRHPDLPYSMGVSNVNTISQSEVQKVPFNVYDKENNRNSLSGMTPEQTLYDDKLDNPLVFDNLTFYAHNTTNDVIDALMVLLEKSLTKESDQSFNKNIAKNNSVPENINNNDKNSNNIPVIDTRITSTFIPSSSHTTTLHETLTQSPTPTNFQLVSLSPNSSQSDPTTNHSTLRESQSAPPTNNSTPPTSHSEKFAYSLTPTSSQSEPITQTSTQTSIDSKTFAHSLSPTSSQSEPSTYSSTPTSSQLQKFSQNASPTSSQSEIFTPSSNSTISQSETFTQNSTSTSPQSGSFTNSLGPTSFQSELFTYSSTPTNSQSEPFSPSSTPTSSQSETFTLSSSSTSSHSETFTQNSAPTSTHSGSFTSGLGSTSFQSKTFTPSSTSTSSQSEIFTQNSLPNSSQSGSFNSSLSPKSFRSETFIPSSTPTSSQSQIFTQSSTPTSSQSETSYFNQSPFPTSSQAELFTLSSTPTSPQSQTFTQSSTLTGSQAETFTPSLTPTSSQSKTFTPTSTLTSSQAETFTPNSISTSSQSDKFTPSSTPTSSQAETFTPSSTPTSTQSEIFTPSSTLTSSQSETSTPSSTLTGSQAETFTPSSTPTSSQSETFTPSSTLTSSQAETFTPSSTPTSSLSTTSTNTQTVTESDGRLTYTAPINMEKKLSTTNTINKGSDGYEKGNENLLKSNTTDRLNTSKSIDFKCQTHIRGKFADKTNCSKYYICIGYEEPIPRVCPNNTVYSEINKSCSRNLSHCIKNNDFQCATEGRFSDYLLNNIYYICLRNKNNQTFNKYKFQCLPGYKMDMNLIKCLLSPNVTDQVSSSDSKSSNTNSEKESTEKKIKNTTSEKTSSPYRCTDEGIFADPNDKHCRVYYECKKTRHGYRRKRRRCENDEYFDPDKEYCVDTDSYECEN